MKKATFFVFLFVVHCSFAQQGKKLWGGLELGYGISVWDSDDNYRHLHTESYTMDLSTIRALAGYYFLPDWSLGMGVGLNTYTMPGHSVLPAWIDVRHHPFRDKEIVLNGGVGLRNFHI